jgi:hypothetical protein
MKLAVHDWKNKSKGKTQKSNGKAKDKSIGKAGRTSQKAKRKRQRAKVGTDNND